MGKTCCGEESMEKSHLWEKSWTWGRRKPSQVLTEKAVEVGGASDGVLGQQARICEYLKMAVRNCWWLLWRELAQIKNGGDSWKSRIEVTALPQVKQTSIVRMEIRSSRGIKEVESIGLNSKHKWQKERLKIKESFCACTAGRMTNTKLAAKLDHWHFLKCWFSDSFDLWQFQWAQRPYLISILMLTIERKQQHEATFMRFDKRTHNSKKLIHAKSKRLRHCETMKKTYNMSAWGHRENTRITSETTPPVGNP